MSALLNSKFGELESIMANEGGIIDLEIPSFRIKRSHKKSRLGCINCKRRRVKVSRLPEWSGNEDGGMLIACFQCDEKQPSCDRCRFRGLTCAYAERPNQSPTVPDPPSGKSASTSASPGSQTSSDQLWSPGQEPWTVAGISDTELARQYFSHTVDKLAATSTRPEQFEMWRAVLPAIAYNSMPVRRGMLTLAAMDLHFSSSDDPETAMRYLEVAEHHGEIFVRESRRQLREMQSAEIDSNLASSRLLCVLGLAFYHVHRRNGAMLTDGTSWTWLQLLRGVRPVNIAAFEAKQAVDPAFSLDLLPEVPLFKTVPDPPSGYPFMQCDHPLFGLARDSWPERLRALQEVLAQSHQWLSQEEAGEIATALDLLDKISQHLFSGRTHSPFRAVITWPGAIPKGFVDMLVGCSPMALAVYAHWLVLVVLVEHNWWMTGMGRDGIREICGMLSNENPAIQSLLQWPRHITEVSTTMAPDALLDPDLMQ